MFRTNRLSEDTHDIYFVLMQGFGKIAATKMMKVLLRDRTYNIQLVGPTGVGKSSFVQKLLTNTFNPNYIPGAIPQASIAFPTSLGKVVFNISECIYGIHQPGIDPRVRQEWENMDAFFVMLSHQNKASYLESKKWIQTIRRVLQRRDVPIVLVDLKCDRRGTYDLQPNIGRLCVLKDIKYVQVSSKAGTNIHHPFLALEDTLRTLDRNIFDHVPNIPMTPLLLPPPAPPLPAPPHPDEEE